MSNDIGINKIQAELKQLLTVKGHMEDILNKDVYAITSLIHTEVSEYTQLFKKYGLEEAFKEDRAMEIADIIFRALNLAIMEEIDIAKALQKKMDFNWERPYKFGTVEERRSDRE